MDAETSPTADDIDNVLAYWLLPKPLSAEEVDAKRRFWFEGSSDTDREIRTRFSDLVAKARAGELDAWKQTPRGTLALTILLDQFTRNIHRGSPEAFSHDPVVLEIARAGFDAGRFDDLDVIDRMFLALPFRHAEDIDAQKRAVALAVEDARRGEAHLLEFLVYSVDWARKHLDVIVRFGRFPHRNATLGRISTAEEVAYVEYLKRAGQWL